MSLTTTQASALVELRRFGHLRPSNRAFSRWDGRRTFQRRTLQALVDAGYAEWRLAVRGTRNGPVTYDGFVTPVEVEAVPEPTNRWSIYFDPEEPRPRTPHTRCPHCGTLDQVVEVDRTVRFNRLDLSSNGATATALIGDDGDWEFETWLCQGCGSEDLIAPEGFQILDWL